MSKKRPTKKCKCLPTVEKVCRCRTAARDCNDITEIIRALTYEDARRRAMRIPKAPQFKTKQFIPPHFKDTCVPMTPSMHTRLRYIGHCDPFPPEKPYYKRPPSSRFKRESAVDFASTSDDMDRKDDTDNKKKRVRYMDREPGDINMPIPSTYVLHAESDKAIFQMSSPNTSGENIAAKKATVKPAELKPPIPAKSGYDMYKPHSGIVLNRDMEFVPEAVHAPGPYELPKKPKKKKPCYRGGVCRNIKCKDKKCRKYNAKRRRLLAKRRKRRHSDDSLYTLIGGGATDGKPRSRTTRKHVPDDDAVCGLDDIPKPEHATIPMGLKKGSFKTHSLTVLPCTKDRKPEIHYGILTGSFNMYDGKYSARSRGRQALTMSVMAYCLAFHYHPKQWTMKLVDNLVDAGDQWYLQCADKVHDHSAVQGMCEVLPFGKKQTLLLNGRKMQVLLCEPDVVGYTMSLDPTVYNLCRALRAFFRENRAGILLTRFLKVVIWKDKICYYIFDPAGRNSKAYSNFATGSAALINVKDIDSVSEVLLARSVLEDQKFVLAPVKVLKMVDEKCDEDFESDKELTLAEKAMMSYRILNENCAIVNANMHLGDRCFEEAKFRQALPIAVAAMTYAKISPPNTWFTKTLDKILRLGNKLYVDCAHPKVMIDLSIDNIPNEIMIGPYACEIIIYRERVKGQLFTTKECLFNIRTGLEEFFSHEYNSGILDFNNYALAIWRQREMFYLFDPYPRTNDGLRSMKIGKACCLMLLNPSTMAEVFTKNWDYLPATTQFYVHAFKVLKLKKKQIKAPLFCTLSDENLPGAKSGKKKVLSMSKDQGDGQGVTMDVLPVDILDSKPFGPKLDEEKMGDIISLVDSIQDDYIPPVPLRYKKMGPDPLEPKVSNLDSPTVSVTQVVPPWPKPRDKTNEVPEPDPDPEPTPPPTPPPLPPPEGGVEEEELGEEEEDEETMSRKKEEAARKKAEEEEARRKAEELPPPMPPPPPSPQPEAEVPLAPMEIYEDEVPQTMEPLNVERRVLLAEDAKYRQKLRQIRKKMTNPLIEPEDGLSVEDELHKPHNFVDLPDNTQMIRGDDAVAPPESADVLPFVAIMAVVTSYKYSINTWTKGIVNFVIDSGKKLYENKRERFQLAPLHIIPKIGIGSQAYNANIDVVGEGPTWQLENILARKFFNKLDRGIITTGNYSCAVFMRNGLYYLYDGSSCNAMGLRSTNDDNGKSCFLRFKSLHDLVCRILYNKDGKQEDEQFILSRIIVRRLLPESRYKLPEDYDYAQGLPKDKKSKQILQEFEPTADKKKDAEDEDVEGRIMGYQLYDGVYRIQGTTALSGKTVSEDIKPCHFVCLIAMLMAAMHPLRTWDQVMVDTCIEKGLEISKKAINLKVCEKRVIKNVILDGKFINVNITKILVINENPEKTLEQYLKAVLKRLRYVLVRFPGNSLVICQTDGFYHLFDPYSSPLEKEVKKEERDERKTSKDSSRAKKEEKKEERNEEKKKAKDSLRAENEAKKEERLKAKDSLRAEKEAKKEERDEKKKKSKDFSRAEKDVKKEGRDEKRKKSEKEEENKTAPVASWTLYRSQDSLISRIKDISGESVDDPEFYTFELSSIKTAPRYSALNYRLSPLFRPDENPNLPYVKRKKSRSPVDEKMYWLNVDMIPWSRMSEVNDLGFQRKTPKTMWKDWDIEFPGDLYSLWGHIHPLDDKFEEKNRGKQYLATCVVALAMTQACNLSAWTGSFLDGIVTSGDAYHTKCAEKVGSAPNHEIVLEDLDNGFEMYPYAFAAKFENVIFGFVYNIYPDRFNLGKALSFFFEKYSLGILTSPSKNLAFGKMGISYFMFDCQSYGVPVFSPGNGAAYMLKCESLNRLIYCMTVTLNLRRHGQQFHLYNATIALTEKTK